MTNKQRILITSVSVIVLCICIVVGFTYSLFTDGEKVTSHLKSGNLDVTLERVELEYTVLNDAGYLEIKEDKQPVDFTGKTDANIFGLEEEQLMAPGAYYEATLKLNNKGTVAFDYQIELYLSGAANKFAEQLKVYIDGDTEGKTLSELKDGNKYVVTGAAAVEAGKAKEFTVKVVFIDSADNNDAQNQSVAFDLVINATQNTEVKR